MLPSRTVEFLAVTFVVTFLPCLGIRQMPIKGWRLGDVRAHHLYKGLLNFWLSCTRRGFPEPITPLLCILSNCLLKFDSFMFQEPLSKMSNAFNLKEHAGSVCSTVNVCIVISLQEALLSKVNFLNGLCMLSASRCPHTCESGCLETQR